MRDIDYINTHLALTAATAHSKINGRFIAGTALKAGKMRRSSTPGVITQGRPRPKSVAELNRIAGEYK